MPRHDSPTSFSAGRRWGIFFSVLVSITAVAALVVMLNYLGARHYLRFYWSTKTSQSLSPATLSLLNSITNDIKIVIYYDKADDLYSDIADLLDEYQHANPKIFVRTVDYKVDPETASQVKQKYRLESSEDKNLVIFQCNDQVQITSGELLANYNMEMEPDTSQADDSGPAKHIFDKRIQDFDGEAVLDACLLRVIGPPLRAYYLTGHGELPLQGQGSMDYSGFGRALANNHVETIATNLIGTNTIPADCNLLIIAGPQHPLMPEELEKVRQYLSKGGRLFALFNFQTVSPEPINTGLESILADWGVAVGMNIISDPDNTASGQGLVVENFLTNHPCIGPLVGSRLLLFPPRSISPNPVPAAQGQEPPTVKALAWTGPHAIIHNSAGDFAANRSVPVIVAVEKKNVKGVQEWGTTRIIVAGDSFFLGGDYIKAEDNSAFAELAARWLLEQTQVMAGVPPHKVADYKVMLTNSQLLQIRWIFLGAMPGGILLLGGLVWLRRRH